MRRSTKMTLALCVLLSTGTSGCATTSSTTDRGSSLAKSDIDSFFTRSGKKPFTRRLIVSTCWGPLNITRPMAPTIATADCSRSARRACARWR